MELFEKLTDWRAAATKGFMSEVHVKWYVSTHGFEQMQ